MQAISMDLVQLTGAIQIEKVLDFTVTAKVNEHATMYFKGIALQENCEKELRGNLEGQEMSLICDGKPYFTGKLADPKIRNEGRYFSIEATCISGSYCFDTQKRSRSFQDTAMTYAAMLKEVEKGSGTGNILPIAGRDEAIGYPIIQYEETDWEFTKRMASHFGTAVIPEIRYGQPQMSMGIVEGTHHTIDTRAEYIVAKRIGSWHIKEKANDCDFNAFIYYKVKDYRNFELGDKVKFLGYNLTVMGKYLYIKDGLLEAEYELGQEQGFGMMRYYNAAIAGKSIQGKVLATAREKLKIHLDIDKTQNIEKAYWYTWMPQTGNLMYCMPKLGTKVHLHFPRQDETAAIATECVRTNGGKVCEEMEDYDYRQFLTEHQKRFAMSPNYMRFMNEAETGGSMINLADGRGIDLRTSENLSIMGMGRLSIKAEGLVSIEAGKLADFNMLGERSGIKLFGSEINKYAEKIYHNGLAKDESIGDIIPVKDGFPAALFSETVMAMLPASSTGEENDPGTLSVIGMTNIGVSQF